MPLAVSLHSEFIDINDPVDKSYYISTKHTHVHRLRTLTLEITPESLIDSQKTRPPTKVILMGNSTIEPKSSSS